VADDYDDGGLSGGNMEGPAPKRLLADIDAGRIDIVLVYKIDRLSRSLADFARMVEVFDRCGVSFSAVTLQINSATSMGRLMLNVLLSFAQFEREVTAERIRDKIAAGKRNGMWMGGPHLLQAVDLQAAAQPHVPRRDRAQGPLLPRPAPADPDQRPVAGRPRCAGPDRRGTARGGGPPMGEDCRCCADCCSRPVGSG
jgi:DNA invertase Pin-like site-specific DNA recombinase